DFQLPELDGLLLDPLAAEGVVVSRGPGSAFHGTDALTGSIELETARVPAALQGGDARRVGGALYGASGDRGAGAVDRFEDARGPWDWRVVGLAHRAGDPTTPAGKLGPFGFDAVDGELALGVVGNVSVAELRFTRTGGVFDLPLGPGQTTPASHVRRELDDHRLQWSGATVIDGTTLRLRGQWQHRSLIATVPTDPRPPVSMVHDAHTLELSGARGGERWSGRLGVAGFVQDSRSREPLPMVPEAHLISGAVFGAERLRAGRWTVLAAARWDARHLEAKNDAS